MRVLLLIGLMAFAGCRNKDKEVARADSVPDTYQETGDSLKTKKSTELPIEVRGTMLLNSYDDNSIAADQKYLGKRVRVVDRIEYIGRTKDGRAYLGFTNIGTLALPEPNGLLLFSKETESQIASVKKNSTVTVEGTCRGRIADGINRGLRGYEWHVVIDGCQLVR